MTFHTRYVELECLFRQKQLHHTGDHVVVEPFAAQNNIIEATIGTETYSTELTTCQKQHHL